MVSNILLILLILPIVDVARVRGIQFRPLMKIAFWFFVIDFFILMWIGAQHPNTPYLEIGQIFTTVYFLHFLVTVPVLGVIENSLYDLINHQEQEQKSFLVSENSSDSNI